jgi:hypothetical protein
MSDGAMGERYSKCPFSALITFFNVTARLKSWSVLSVIKAFPIVIQMKGRVHCGLEIGDRNT